MGGLRPEIVWLFTTLSNYLIISPASLGLCVAGAYRAAARSGRHRIFGCWCFDGVVVWYGVLPGPGSALPRQCSEIQRNPK